MEKIIIKNFGPIKDVELEIKDINVFIGSTSSGKSTVAKLIAIFKDIFSKADGDINDFISDLKKYNIDFSVNDNTYIEFEARNYSWKLEERIVSSNHPNKELEPIVNSLFALFEKLTDAFIQSKEKMTSLKDEVANRTANWAALADLLKFLEENKNRFDSKMLRETLPVIRNLYTSRTQESDNRYSFTEKVASVNDLLNTLFDSAKLNLIYYIPAERILLSMVAESIFGLMSNDVSIAECIKDFGAHFESARRKINQLSIPFLDSKYNYSDKSNFITFSDGAKVKLEQASSGLQSIIPLLLVVESNTIDESVTKKCFVLEEPELNLYPTVQKELIEFIVERINKSKDKLIITTHSPYVLTSLDNLIQASNAAKVNPEQKEKVVEIVPEEKWVDFDRVACYYFEEGTCRSTLDTENQTIGASNIDDVSEELGKTFDQLLELKYAHVS